MLAHFDDHALMRNDKKLSSVQSPRLTNGSNLTRYLDKTYKKDPASAEGASEEIWAFWEMIPVRFSRTFPEKGARSLSVPNEKAAAIHRFGSQKSF